MLRKYTLALAVAALLSSTIAFGQATGPGAGTAVPTPPAGGVPSSNNTVTFARRQSYAATIVGLTPAASATDLFTISGSATKVISVQRIDCVGTATAAGSAVLNTILRSTANTGGTSTTPAATPLDPLNNAATAVVKAYTANPTVGTAVGTPVRVATMNLAPASASGATYGSFNFYDAPLFQPVMLRGAAASLAVNANGVTLPTGASLTCTMSWTEQ